METIETAKQLLQDHLQELETKIDKSLDFYQLLTEEMPEEEQWKINKWWEPTGEKFFVSGESAIPVEYLEEVKQLVALLKSAINIMSIDQLSALYLGLGFPGLNLPFWGIKQTIRNVNELRKSKEFHEELLENTPDKVKSNPSIRFSHQQVHETGFL